MNRYLSEFLDYCRRKGYASHTIHDYGMTVGAFFAFLRETCPDVTEITDITREMVMGYEKHLAVKKDGRGKVMSRNRRRRYLGNLRAFFAYLEKEEKIFQNPAVNMALPREKRRLIKDILTPEEMETLLKSCEGTSARGLRDRAIMELLYSTGIRADELCGIEMGDLDLDERLLYVRKGKWGNERVVPFGSSAGYWVSRYIETARSLLNEEATDYLFVSLRGTRLEPQTLRRMVKARAGAAGIEKPVTTHTFRHSCAAHMLRGRADIRYVQKQLGHRRISTTEQYLRVEITDLKEVHERCHPREQESWEEER